VTLPSGLVLLDTSILIHVLRDSGLGKKVSADHGLRTRPEKPLISIVTVGEALAFARKKSWGEKKTEQLKALLRQLVIVDINSADVLEKYADIDAFCESQGRKPGKNDLWIAATSAVASAHLLTTDKDYDLLNGVFLQRTYYDPGGAYP
jgi:tRNA(fMet)-specific endonuclease VapC